jgi:hypothetical protein
MLNIIYQRAADIYGNETIVRKHGRNSDNTQDMKKTIVKQGVDVNS